MKAADKSQGELGTPSSARSAPIGGLLRPALLVAGLALAGRILGFVRDVSIARFFGASAETDALLVAWTVPETVSPLLVEFAVIYALVPVFVRARMGGTGAQRTIERLLGPTALILAIATAALVVVAPVFVTVVTPGIVEYELAVRCVRAAAVTVLGFGLTGFLIAALRSHDIFGVPASIYMTYNLAIIAAIVALHEELGVLSAAIGYGAGALAMVAVQVPSYLRHVGPPKLTLGSLSFVRAEFLFFVPIAAFVLLRHMQIYVERFLASLIEAGAISVLNFAAVLSRVPLGLVVAVAVVTYPAVARIAATGRYDELRSTFERDLKLVLFLTMPAAAVLVVFADPLVELIFERGSFTAADTESTSDVMQLYSLGLLGQAVIPLAVLPVYALRIRMSTPIISAAAGLVIGGVLGVLLMQVMDVSGLALASAVAATFIAVDLLRRVDADVLSFDGRSVRTHLGKIGVAGIAASLLGLGVAAAVPENLPVQVSVGIFAVGVAYVALCRLLRTDHVEELLRPVGNAIARLRTQGS